MESSLRSDIHRLGFHSCCAYIFASILLIGAFLYANHLQQVRLAESFASAARHSLVLRDFRQAIFTLSPALAKSFFAVGVRGSDGNLSVGLPNNSAILKDPGILSIKIVVPVLADHSLQEQGRRLATTEFHYSIRHGLWLGIGGAILLFFLFAIVFFASKKRLEERHSLMLQQSHLEAERAMARQIAHDIRSPLTALNMVVSKMDTVSSEYRSILAKATGRINGIANGLLNHGLSQCDTNILVQSDGPEGRSRFRPVLLMHLVGDIVKEKRIQFIEREEIEIRCNLSQANESYGRVCPTEFSRALSNLINNAADAIEQSGVIDVTLRSYRHEILISISDNGKGMPADVLAKLGNPGVSYGKQGRESGFGLGLSHAQKCVEEAGGKMQIQSRVNVGTIVNLILPKISI